MIALLLVLTGCAPKSGALEPGYLPPGGDVVGTVNGEPVTQAVIDAELSQLPPELRMQLEMSGQAGEISEQILLKEALYQEAIREGVLDDEDIRTQLAISARDTLIEALLIKIADERADDDALQAWYDDNIDQFKQDQAAAAHILVETEEKAAELFAALSENRDAFADTARANSIDPSAAFNGGDLGWFGQVDMVPAFSEAVFGAEPGDLVGPVQTQFGWHVIAVSGFRDAIPLDDVRDELRGVVQDDLVGAYIEEIQERAVSIGGDDEEAAEEEEVAPEAAE